PTVCLAQGGIPGYCRLTEACSQAACDAGLIVPIRQLLAVKANSQRDVRLEWPADPNADSYEPWWVKLKADVPLAYAGGGPEIAVTGSTPSTVTEAVHRSVIGSAASPVFFYNVVPVCSRARPRGACCSSGGG